MLFAFTGNIEYTLSQNLHTNFMFWLDEGLVEAGFWQRIDGMYNSTSDLRALEKQEDGIYKFPLPRLIWQTGVSTLAGQVERLSGIYVDGNFYSNDSSNYTIDYHNGFLLFNDSAWQNIVNLYGNSPTILVSSYDAKSVYVVYNNTHDIYATLGKITKDWETASLEEFGYMTPICIGGIKRSTVQPYELGGTRETYLEYGLLVLSNNQDDADKISDILVRQKDVEPPSIQWSGLYNDDGTLMFTDTYDVYSKSKPWRRWWIEDIEGIRFGDKIFATEFNIAIHLLGVT